MSVNILTIAGSDSCGGAGIQADIKAVENLGGYAGSVITVLTAQNRQEVTAIQALPAAFLKQQLKTTWLDRDWQAIKIGMLYSLNVMQVVYDFLQTVAVPIIIDPVMVASSGAILVDPKARVFLQENILPLATVITPNMAEAAVLSGCQVGSVETMQAVAKQLGIQHQTNVLVKGGHLEGEKAVDVLYARCDGQSYFLEGEYLAGVEVHGSGCTLAAALAYYLGAGEGLLAAASKAKAYVARWLVACS